MTRKTNAPAGAGAQRDQLGGGSELRVRRVHPMLVATRGRIEFAVRCPGCKHLHRHISLGISQGPCGAVYNLGIRRGRAA